MADHLIAKLNLALETKTSGVLAQLARLDAEVARAFARAEHDAQAQIDAALAGIESGLALRAHVFEERLADMANAAFDAALATLAGRVDALARQANGKHSEAPADPAPVLPLEDLLAAEAAMDEAACEEAANAEKERQAAIDGKIDEQAAADREHDAFRPGSLVVCIDDHDGAHFLRAGHAYTIGSVQRDSNGQLRLNLVGMARAWEADRFRPALQTDPWVEATGPTDDDLKADAEPIDLGGEIVAVNGVPVGQAVTEAGGSIAAQALAAESPAIADPEDDEDDDSNDPDDDEESASACALPLVASPDGLHERKGEGRQRRYSEADVPIPGGRYYVKGKGRKWVEVIFQPDGR